MLVITSGAGSTIILRVHDVTSTGCESVSFTVNEKVPNWVGVPKITPEFAFNDIPAGKAPLAISHVYGEAPPSFCSMKEYDELTVPLVRSPVVTITSGPGTTVICSG